MRGITDEPTIVIAAAAFPGNRPTHGPMSSKSVFWLDRAFREIHLRRLECRVIANDGSERATPKVELLFGPPRPSSIRRKKGE